MINANASDALVNQDVEISNVTSVESASIAEVNLTRWWYCNRWYCQRFGRCGGCRRLSTPTTLAHSAVLSNISTTLGEVMAEDELDMINANAVEVSLSQDVKISNITSVENASIPEVNLTRWWYCNRWYCQRFGRCGGCRRLSTPTTLEHSAVLSNISTTQGEIVAEDELDMINANAD